MIEQGKLVHKAQPHRADPSICGGTLFYIVQYLNSTIEEVLESHVPRLRPQAKPTNHLISKVHAFGNGFEIVADAFNEIHFRTSVDTILVGTEVPLCGCNTLETATEQIKLLC